MNENIAHNTGNRKITIKYTGEFEKELGRLEKKKCSFLQEDLKKIEELLKYGKNEDIHGSERYGGIGIDDPWIFVYKYPFWSRVSGGKQPFRLIYVWMLSRYFCLYTERPARLKVGNK